MTNKNKNLFRQEALQSLNISSRLNERLNIVLMSSWIIFFSLAIILLTLVLFGFFGSIPTQVSGKGILLASKGSLFNAVAPEGNGRIISIVVKPGDMVKKNDVIALLNDPDLSEKMYSAQNFLNKLINEQQLLEKQFTQELANFDQQMKTENSIYSQSIASNTEKLQEFEKLLDIKRAAFKRGLITSDQVALTSQIVYETKDAIKLAQSNLQENQVKQAHFISQWKERLHALKLKALDQEYQVNSLQIQLQGAKEVRSPISGIVTFIQGSIGEKMAGGQVVATIATEAKHLDAIVYVPAENGKRIKIGMPALISPTTIKKEEFGSIRGKVVQVSLFPITAKNMLSILQNEELIKEFTKEGTVIGVRFHLNADPNAYSGYEWTSVKGSDQLVTAGTLVNALITVRSQAPVTLIIPAFKKLLGD